ncbi:uncharacterized protein LOC144174871 isoform X2 [Haemaphysalis longicornis]
MVVALSVVVQQLQRLLALQLCSYLWAFNWFNCPPSADQHLLTAVTVPLACLQHSSCHSSGNCHSSAGHLSQPNGFPDFSWLLFDAPADWALACACW